MYIEGRKIMVKTKKVSFLQGVRSEFKRIKWMKRSEVLKQLFTVVTIISIVALLVVASDMIGATGFSLLTKFR
jgi:preprotein translocase, secE subunit